LRCGGSLARVLAPGDRLGLGAGFRPGCGFGVAISPQIVIESVKDAGVDRVQAFAAQGGLDLLGDQAAVVLDRIWRDGLVACGAPLDPEVEQLPEGLDARSGVLSVRDLDPQAASTFSACR
jgi:hypothetical protein